MIEQSEKELLEAVVSAKQSGTQAQLANAVDHLAIHYHYGCRYKEAAMAYHQSIGMWGEILGASHPTLGTLMVNLASVYLELRQYDSAEPMFRQALTILEDDADFDDTGSVTALTHFGKMLARRHSPDAKEFESRVTRLRAQVAVPHPAYAHA